MTRHRRIMAAVAAAALPLALAASPANAAPARSVSGELVSVNTKGKVLVLRTGDGELKRLNYRHADSDFDGFSVYFDYARDDLPEGEYDCDMYYENYEEGEGHGGFERIASQVLAAGAGDDAHVRFETTEQGVEHFYVTVDTCDGVIDGADHLPITRP